MDENQHNKLIGLGIVLIIASYTLQMITPFLIYGVGLLIACRILMAFNKPK